MTKAKKSRQSQQSSHTKSCVPKTADSCSSPPSVTRVPCLSLSDSPCKAELSSINKKQAGKKLLGETHTRAHTYTTDSVFPLTHAFSYAHTQTLRPDVLLASVSFASQVSICPPVMRRATTGPTSVTAAAASAGVWIATATRWPDLAPAARQTAVSRIKLSLGVGIQ